MQETIFEINTKEGIISYRSSKNPQRKRMAKNAINSIFKSQQNDVDLFVIFSRKYKLKHNQKVPVRRYIFRNVGERETFYNAIRFIINSYADSFSENKLDLSDSEDEDILQVSKNVDVSPIDLTTPRYQKKNGSTKNF